MLIAPTEPPAIKTLGTVSPRPEMVGADILFVARKLKVGIQRKTVSDLIASVHDGRLQREVSQLQGIDIPILIVEGRPTWTLDGHLVTKGFGAAWTKAQHRGILWSAREKGIWVQETVDLDDTVECVKMFERWCQKGQHKGLVRRPGPVSIWGKVNNEDYARHLVMGLPGVGPELAERIVARYGVPFGWRITPDDLVAIDGIGPKKAEAIWATLDNSR